MIFRAFETRDMRFLIDLFRICVRPVLEYASHVWCPHLKVDITLIERVQRMFTKRIPCLRHLTYDQRLSSSKLESLEHRRFYLDLVLLNILGCVHVLLYYYPYGIKFLFIFFCKIVHGFVDINMYDIGVLPVTERQSLRN